MDKRGKLELTNTSPKAKVHRVVIPLLQMQGDYRIAGKFGGDLNLAVWRSAF